MKVLMWIYSCRRMELTTDREKRVLLIIDDDQLLCDAVNDYLSSENLKVLTAHTGADGLRICARQKTDIVLLDQNLPDGEGHRLCEVLLKHNDQAKIIFITAYPSFDNAVKAVRSGAYDYLSKPFEMDEMSLAVKNALTTLRLENIARVEDYRNVKEGDTTVLIGRSREFAEVLRLVDLAATTDAPALITGETGTGKNLVAKAIHYKSMARKSTFISINCAAIPENLIEAELFGYEKGAFTGAESARLGIFEMAEGGTLFLDEIGEMPMHLQTKLLSVLEDKKIKRLGGDMIRSVNVRIMAATSSDIERNMDKTFRSDLYYRLSVIRIHIPPLRERRQDIPEMCDYLFGQIAPGYDIRLDDPEMKRLMQYDWPGNVRELRNVLERAFLLRKGQSMIISEFLKGPSAQTPSGDDALLDDPILSLEEVEKQYIKSALDKLSYNITKTSRALNVSISTLKRKIKEYRLK